MINLKNVSVTYPNGVVGLQETSIRFFGREVTVLLGLSGAGKSTLLRTLNHLTANSG
jgi:phosphonate transport system ATP-binding protein